MSSDEQAFMNYIIENPDDDAPRLVFADWLEENGRAPEADLIRVQIKLEPIRGQYELEGYEALGAEERSCLKKSERPLALETLERDSRWDLKILRRRGFYESLHLKAFGFPDVAPALTKAFPTLRKLRLYCLNGQAEKVVNTPELSQFTELDLACWYTAEEAERLAASPHLKQLERVIIRTGGFGEAISTTNLIKLFAKPSTFPKLKELVIYDPWTDEDLPKLAKLADKTAKRSIAKIVVPDKRYCFAPDFYYFCPGKLPDGRSMVAKPAEDHLCVIEFTKKDLPKKERKVRYTPELKELAQKYFEDYSVRKELRASIHKHLGTTPAFIRVHEFDWEDGEFSPHRGRASHSDCFNSVGYVDPVDPDEYSEEQDHGMYGEFQWVLEGGEYICGNGWCNNRGQVHST